MDRHLMFVGMASTALLARSDGMEIRRRSTQIDVSNLVTVVLFRINAKKQLYAREQV